MSRYRIRPSLGPIGVYDTKIYIVEEGEYHGDGVGQDAYDWKKVSEWSSEQNAKVFITKRLEAEKRFLDYHISHKPYIYPEK